MDACLQARAGKHPNHTRYSSSPNAANEKLEAFGGLGSGQVQAGDRAQEPYEVVCFMPNSSELV